MRFFLKYVIDAFSQNYISVKKHYTLVTHVCECTWLTRTCTRVSMYMYVYIYIYI